MPLYEIWLAMNIVWEFALANLAILIILAAAIALLFGAAVVKGKPAWCVGFKVGMVAAVLVTLAGFFFVPALIDSSISDLTYWVDWANLFAVSAVFGAAAFALCWPLGAIFAGGRRPGGSA